MGAADEPAAEAEPPRDEAKPAQGSGADETPSGSLAEPPTPSRPRAAPNSGSAAENGGAPLPVCRVLMQERSNSASATAAQETAAATTEMATAAAAEAAAEAPAADSQGSSAPRSGRRVPTVQSDLPAGKRVLLERLKNESVTDVAAELGRLRIEYAPSTSTAELFVGIQIGLNDETTSHLKALARKLRAVPTIASVKDFEGEGQEESARNYPIGLHRLLQGTAKIAQLCKQPLLGRPSLLVRAKRKVKQGEACGYLVGRLTEEPVGKDAIFPGHKRLISAGSLSELAKECGAAEYKGPDLTLDMSTRSNEFLFLPDTVLRPKKSNVELCLRLLRDDKKGVVLPVYVVRAMKDIAQGEELVAHSARDNLSIARHEMARMGARKEPAANQAAEDADRASEGMEVEAVGQLLPLGWRQHTLDVFFQRHLRLAGDLAGGKGKKDGLAQLRAARDQAVTRYYQQTGGSRSGGEKKGSSGANVEKEGSSDKGSGSGGQSSSSGSQDSKGEDSDSSDNGEGAPGAPGLQELQEALEKSLVQHPPPPCPDELAKLLHLEPGERFQPFNSFEPPLQPSTNFDGLEDGTRKLLDRLKGKKPQELPAGCREKLGSDEKLDGSDEKLDGSDPLPPRVHVCEVLARLHHVRLLTPPNCRALSLHAPAKDRKLQEGECAAIYVGKAFETENAPDQDSAYLFDISAREISEASGAKYAGPGLVVDAGQHRNAAAFANCVFASGRASNLRPQAVWDKKRPHMAFVYCGEEASQPSEELLLDYGFNTYWAVQVVKARKAHEAYAALAGEVILSLREALWQAGASEAQLKRCLAPVDLTAEEHQRYRRADEDEQ